MAVVATAEDGPAPTGEPLPRQESAKPTAVAAEQHAPTVTPPVTPPKPPRVQFGTRVVEQETYDLIDRIQRRADGALSSTSTFAAR